MKFIPDTNNKLYINNNKFYCDIIIKIEKLKK